LPSGAALGPLHDALDLVLEQRLPAEAHVIAIEVIAYDDEGKVIARKTGNNINSVSGRPRC
jgi:hypothetical protein